MSRVISYHCAIILSTETMQWGLDLFKFENVWLGDQNFNNKLLKWWRKVTIKDAFVANS